MKKVLLIHGFESSRDKHWFPWLRKELSSIGYEVVNETWPNPDHPNLEEALSFLREKVSDFGPNDIVVGHSIGAFFALKLAEERYFEALYLVTPALGGLPFDRLREEWEESDIDALERTINHGFDLKKIKATRKFAIFSTDDPWISYKKSKDLLDGSFELVLREGLQHMTENKYPFLIDIIYNNSPPVEISMI